MDSVVTNPQVRSLASAEGEGVLDHRRRRRRGGARRRARPGSAARGPRRGRAPGRRGRPRRRPRTRPAAHSPRSARSATTRSGRPTAKSQSSPRHPSDREQRRAVGEDRDPADPPELAAAGPSIGRPIADQHRGAEGGRPRRPPTGRARAAMRAGPWRRRSAPPAWAASAMRSPRGDSIAASVQSGSIAARAASGSHPWVVDAARRAPRRACTRRARRTRGGRGGRRSRAPGPTCAHGVAPEVRRAAPAMRASSDATAQRRDFARGSSASPATRIATVVGDGAAGSTSSRGGRLRRGRRLTTSSGRPSSASVRWRRGPLRARAARKPCASSSARPAAVVPPGDVTAARSDSGRLVARRQEAARAEQRLVTRVRALSPRRDRRARRPRSSPRRAGTRTPDPSRTAR